MYSCCLYISLVDLPELTCFVTNRRRSKHTIDITMAYKTLGADKQAALLVFHAFTGCDQTSKFCRKFKLTCCKVFRAAHKNIIYTFQRLGDNEADTLD